MDKEEKLRQMDHYRCRRCGQLNAITETVCTRPSCRAQLGIHGEIVFGKSAPVTPAPSVEKPVIPEKPVRSAPQAPRKQESVEEALHGTAHKSFLQKKTLLIWLDILLLLVYALITLGAELVWSI